jgi:hypothetical protein
MICSLILSGFERLDVSARELDTGWRSFGQTFARTRGQYRGVYPKKIEPMGKAGALGIRQDCAEPTKPKQIRRSPREASPHFRLRSVPDCGSYLVLDIEFVEAKPLLITGYLLAASKEMLTKHSQFNRIAPIKIIRRVPSQQAVKV